MSTSFELHFEKMLKKEKKMELIDVVDENNELTGEKCDREQVHQKGLWHREVTVIIVNSDSQLLLQKRAPKKVAPNRWSLTAGHVDSGETEKHAALRETQEELGIRNLTLDDFKLIGIEKTMRNRGAHINNKFDNLFLLKTDTKLDEFILQKSEVTEVRYVTIDEMKEICQNKEKYVSQFTNIFFEEYFWKILEKLENKNEEELLCVKK